MNLFIFFYVCIIDEPPSKKVKTEIKDEPEDNEIISNGINGTYKYLCSPFFLFIHIRFVQLRHDIMYFR